MRMSLASTVGAAGRGGRSYEHVGGHVEASIVPPGVVRPVAGVPPRDRALALRSGEMSGRARSTTAASNAVERVTSVRSAIGKLPFAGTLSAGNGHRRHYVANVSR